MPPPKGNWMKMYDKFGCVLRIETVINNPREFKVRRSGKRKGEIVRDWFPMGKGVANMPRYREVCMAANRRYLEALAAVMRGEHSLQGFRNSNIREHLNEPTTDDLEHRRQSHRTGRLLKLLHAHSLIAKVPRTRRWRVTKHGHAVMSAISTIRHPHNPPSALSRLKSSSHMTTQNDARKMRSC